MTLQQFIKENRQLIDECCDLQPGYRNDSERRLWVLNDEGLYNMARRAGARI